MKIPGRWELDLYSISMVMLIMINPRICIYHFLFWVCTNRYEINIVYISKFTAWVKLSSAVSVRIPFFFSSMKNQMRKQSKRKGKTNKPEEKRESYISFKWHQNWIELNWNFSLTKELGSCAGRFNLCLL